VPLPHGLRVEGKDKTAIADAILDFSLEDKTVLDVGTYYGFFPLYASRRGAQRAVGLESDLERYRIAEKIAQLHGKPYTIHQGRIEDTEFEERFDIVLLLNVLHHLADPIRAMRKAASLCQGKLIVEFCLPSDRAYIQYTYADNPGTVPSTFDRVRAVLRSWVLRIAAYRLPIVAIGNWSYHRIFYFSREAFYNLFVIHHRLFDDIVFRPGLTSPRRAIAVCSIGKEMGASSFPGD
jgi:SAM-dependent methyltransferase